MSGLNRGMIVSVAENIEMLGQILLSAESGAIECCEKMYQSQWRSAPFPASELDSETFDALDDELRFKIAASQVGMKPVENDVSLLEDWFEQVGTVMQGIPPVLVDETLLVGLVNYKGEGNGLDLFSNASELPVFVSKCHSASFFNA